MAQRLPWLEHIFEVSNLPVLMKKHVDEVIYISGPRVRQCMLMYHKVRTKVMVKIHKHTYMCTLMWHIKSILFLFYLIFFFKISSYFLIKVSAG